jgi:hypothetical protein
VTDDEPVPVEIAVEVPVPVAAAPQQRDYSGGFMVTPEVTQPQANEGADMAALLRELSSLGSDTEKPRAGVAQTVGAQPAATGQVVTRPVQTSDPKAAKKKKGFFGR